MKKLNPIRVLSVDTSPLFRGLLSEILGNREDISLVGCANDAYDARDRMRQLPVDVLTLDLDLPRMSGLTFLKLIMERKPMPVVVLSSLTPKGSAKAAEATMAGAVAVLEKPKSPDDRLTFGERLVHGIQIAAEATVRQILPSSFDQPKTSRLTATRPMHSFDPRQIIGLGASTGGTHALEAILASLPAELPGIVVVQHIPAAFSSRFAARLNENCALEVREAKEGDIVRPGVALIAPGGRHMEVHRSRDHYRVVLHSGPEVEHQRPSVDVLFKSLAEAAGSHAVAALLTGMGRDGAAGMKLLRDRKAYTLAQDAESSVVYGMARKAVELDAVDAIVPLENLASKIVRVIETRQHRNETYVH